MEQLYQYMYGRAGNAGLEASLFGGANSDPSRFIKLFEQLYAAKQVSAGASTAMNAEMGGTITRENGETLLRLQEALTGTRTTFADAGRLIAEHTRTITEFYNLVARMRRELDQVRQQNATRLLPGSG